jgi:hypothetical protein
MFERDPLVEHAGKLGHMDSLVARRLDGGPVRKKKVRTLWIIDGGKGCRQMLSIPYRMAQ